MKADEVVIRLGKLYYFNVNLFSLFHGEI